MQAPLAKNERMKKEHGRKGGKRACIINGVFRNAKLLWNEVTHRRRRRISTSTFSLTPKGEKGHDMPRHKEEPNGSMFQCIAAASSVALAGQINPNLAWATYVGVLIYAAVTDRRRNRR